MNLAQYSDLAQIVAAVSTVVALIYLAVQVRAAASAMKADSRRNEQYLPYATSISTILMSPEYSWRACQKMLNYLWRTLLDSIFSWDNFWALKQPILMRFRLALAPRRFWMSAGCTSVISCTPLEGRIFGSVTGLRIQKDFVVMRIKFSKQPMHPDKSRLSDPARAQLGVLAGERT